MAETPKNPKPEVKDDDKKESKKGFNWPDLLVEAGDDIERIGTRLAVATGFAMLLGNKRASQAMEDVVSTGAELLGEAKEALIHPAGEGSRAMDAIHPHTEQFADRQDVAREREDELRRQQTSGAGFLSRLFNPLPLALTTHSDGNPRPAVRVNRRGRWPWSR